MRVVQSTRRTDLSPTSVIEPQGRLALAHPFHLLTACAFFLPVQHHVFEIYPPLLLLGNSRVHRCPRVQHGSTVVIPATLHSSLSQNPSQRRRHETPTQVLTSSAERPRADVHQVSLLDNIVNVNPADRSIPRIGFGIVLWRRTWRTKGCHRYSTGRWRTVPFPGTMKWTTTGSLPSRSFRSLRMHKKVPALILVGHHSDKIVVLPNLGLT